MTPRITTAQLAAQQTQLAETIATMGEAQAQILALLNSGQHATPTAVADAVEKSTTKAKPKAAPAPEPNASDKLLAYVADKGLAFAKGGRIQVNVDAAKAIVRVLQTGKPQVVSLGGVGKLDKRKITHIAIGASDDGKSVITQYLYRPING